MENLQQILDSVVDVETKNKIMLAHGFGMATGANIALDEVIAQIEKIK
jgi:hypothetical protein